ncbi:putative acyl-CoA dehydrogenase AidB [alpha proteobacterium Q-1]|nr:putative acyl-CoA dehydrogenase AidB [alpha proteobacterium Q-1]
MAAPFSRFVWGFKLVQLFLFGRDQDSGPLLKERLMSLSHPPYRPMADLPTHAVTNQPPPLVDYNLYAADAALIEAVGREGDADAPKAADAYGAALGDAAILQAGDDANRHPPDFHPFDRYGQRIDEVRFHPAYHQMMALGMAHGQHSVAWTAKKAGHVRHASLEYLMHQVEAGVCCPLSMTYAVIPALRHHSDLAALWEPKLLSRHYDGTARPVADKASATMGMAMTEKQGGSDVRANSTKAVATSGAYELTGHKWFCSAPMSDAFLTLAYAPGGLSCFFVPRWTPDGQRNRLFIQRLKDKLGNKANASSEIEYHGAYAEIIGDEGAGVRTIIDMVHHTRLDTTIGAASLMRRAVAESIHHARHRTAFQKRLVDQPLMQMVLADMAIEQEAATTLAFRIARSYDDSSGESGEDAAAGGDRDEARAFSRLAVALAKYWLNKRVAPLIAEALEVHGGVGYVEETVMPRLYREAPLNGIWEGSGNVIALDVLRSLHKSPQSVEALMAEIHAAKGTDRFLDRAMDQLGTKLAKGSVDERHARRLVEDMALVLQGSLLVRYAPPAVADAFCASRLGGDWGRAFGTLPDGLDLDAIIERAAPLA